MAKLFQKARSFCKRTTSAFRQDCRFSKKLAFARLVGDLSRKAHLNKLAKSCQTKREQYISRYLLVKLQPVFEKYQNCELGGHFAENAPIWVCWWDGVEVAPALVQQCVRSIQANAGEHKVILITKDSYREYLTVPQHILSRMESKQMGLAHFADYLRVSLLRQYGGLWLDATIFCSQPIPEAYFSVPFFTCRSREQECSYLSRMRWVTFVLGGFRECLFYTALQEAFESYWAQCDAAIDYLFFDHIIDLLYENIPAIKAAIDETPPNNLHRDDLQAAMNATLPADKFQEVLHEDTVMYKLSWRESYAEKTPDGEDTVYQAFINGEFLL